MAEGAFALAGFVLCYAFTQGHGTITRWFADRGEARKVEALARKSEAEARLIEAQTQAKLAVPVVVPTPPALPAKKAKAASDASPA